MNFLLTILCLLPLTALAGGLPTIVTPNGLHGFWDMEYQGCESTPLKERMEAIRDAQTQTPSVNRMIINGNLLIEEVQFSFFCIFHRESTFKERQRNRFVLQSSFSKGSRLCEEKFSLERAVPEEYEYSFTERIRPYASGGEGPVLVVTSDGEAKGCPAGDRYVSFYSRRRMNRRDPVNDVYEMVASFVQMGDVALLKSYVRSSFRFDQSLKDNPNFNPLEALNLERRDMYGRTVLMVATARGHEEMIQALIEAGASQEAHDRYGNDLSFFRAYRESVVAATK